MSNPLSEFNDYTWFDADEWKGRVYLSLCKRYVALTFWGEFEGEEDCAVHELTLAEAHAFSEGLSRAVAAVCMNSPTFGRRWEDRIGLCGAINIVPPGRRVDGTDKGRHIELSADSTETTFVHEISLNTASHIVRAVDALIAIIKEGRLEG